MHPKLIIATTRQSQAQDSTTHSLLDEIARQGARLMLLEALTPPYVRKDVAPEKLRRQGQRDIKNDSAECRV